MANTLIEIKCSFCGRTWQEDIRQLERLDQAAYKQVIFRGKANPRLERYRARCPQDGTYTIVEVQVEE